MIANPRMTEPKNVFVLFCKNLKSSSLLLKIPFFTFLVALAHGVPEQPPPSSQRVPYLMYDALNQHFWLKFLKNGFVILTQMQFEMMTLATTETSMMMIIIQRGLCNRVRRVFNFWPNMCNGLTQDTSGDLKYCENVSRFLIPNQKVSKPWICNPNADAVWDDDSCDDWDFDDDDDHHPKGSLRSSPSSLT